MAHALGRLLVHARGPIEVIEAAQEELKAYEAAVEALERLVAEVGLTDYGARRRLAEAQDAARAALARLRDNDSTVAE